MAPKRRQQQPLVTQATEPEPEPEQEHEHEQEQDDQPTTNQDNDNDNDDPIAVKRRKLAALRKRLVSHNLIFTIHVNS